MQAMRVTFFMETLLGEWENRTWTQGSWSEDPIPSLRHNFAASMKWKCVIWANGWSSRIHDLERMNKGAPKIDLLIVIFRTEVDSLSKQLIPFVASNVPFTSHFRRYIILYSTEIQLPART